MVEPDHLSSRSYYVFYENSFVVLPDQKTIIGVEFAGHRNTVIMEDITHRRAHSVTSIGTHGHYIYTMAYVPESRTLLVGDHVGNVYQLSKRPKACGWKLDKSYNNLGIGLVYSSVRLGHLVIFGGYNFGIRVIDVAKRRLFSSTFKTALCFVYSMRFYVRSRCQVVLLISGQTAVYSDSQTDVLDATRLFRHFGVSLDQDCFESVSEEAPLDGKSEDSACERQKPVPEQCWDMEAFGKRLLSQMDAKIRDLCEGLIRRIEQAIRPKGGRHCSGHSGANCPGKAKHGKKGKLTRRLRRIIRDFKSGFLGSRALIVTPR